MWSCTASLGRAADQLRFGKGSATRTSEIGVAVFNDNTRNAMRGDLDGSKTGFIKGATSRAPALKKGIVGSMLHDSSICDFTDQPLKASITFQHTTTWRSGTSLRKSCLMQAFVQNLRTLPPQWCFLLRVCRSSRVELKLDAPKAANRTATTLAMRSTNTIGLELSKFNSSFNYLKGLIALRKAFPAFRLSSSDAVRKNLKFLPDSSLPLSTIGFTLEAEKKILVVFHGSTQSENMQLPTGTWTLHADGARAGLTPLGTVSGNLKLEPLSGYVLVQK